MSVIALQQAHGFIPAIIVTTAFVSQWAAFKVGRARKQYSIAYPQMYAEQSDKNAKAFNCVQRAHQNVLENIPTLFALLLTASVYRPEYAAICGAVRVLGFIFYVSGYASGDPSKRQRGSFGLLGLLGLVGLSIEASLKMIGYL